jgi:hypothetical protein
MPKHKETIWKKEHQLVEDKLLIPENEPESKHNVATFRKDFHWEL